MLQCAGLSIPMSDTGFGNPFLFSEREKRIATPVLKQARNASVFFCGGGKPPVLWHRLVLSVSGSEGFL